MRYMATARARFRRHRNNLAIPRGRSMTLFTRIPRFRRTATGHIISFRRNSRVIFRCLTGYLETIDVGIARSDGDVFFMCVLLRFEALERYCN